MRCSKATHLTHCLDWMFKTSVIDTGYEVLTLMQGEKGERWRKLCEQAAIEQDPQKLLELTKKINDLLLGKQKRLNSGGTSEQA